MQRVESVSDTAARPIREVTTAAFGVLSAILAQRPSPLEKGRMNQLVSTLFEVLTGRS